MLGLIAAAKTAGARVGSLPCGASQAFVLARQLGGLEFAIDPRALAVEVEEDGQVVELLAAGVARYVAVPLRYGLHRLQPIRGEVITIRRSGSGNGRMHVRVLCGNADPNESTWFMSAADLAREIERPVADAQLYGLLERARASTGSAPTPRARAFGLHMVAQIYVVNGRHASSVSAFADAEDAWNALGDHERAFVARVAGLEGQYRAGRFQNVLSAVRGVERDDRVNDAYFRTRLRNTGCLALQATGRMFAALRCFESTTTTYLRLGEHSEYAVALQAYGNALRESGNLQEAMRKVQQGIRYVGGQDLALNRGRLKLLAADISVRSGDIVKSLRLMQDAIDDFETARVRRWIANGWLAVADLYTRLGATQEARVALSRVLELLNSQDDPARLAQAFRIAADNEREAGNIELAAWLGRAAEREYVILDMPLARDNLRLSFAEIALQRGDLEWAERELSKMASAPQSFYRARRELLLARLALARGALDDAAVKLSSAHSNALAVSDRVSYALVAADLKRERGDNDGALKVLVRTAGRLRTLARHAGNPILEYMIRRQLTPLRLSGMDGLLSSPAPDIAQRVLSWLALTTAAGSPRPSTGGVTSEFDKALAQELLSHSDLDRRDAVVSAQRKLFAVLSRQSQVGSEAIDLAAGMDVDAIQHALGESEAFAVIAEGKSRAGLLWVTSTSAQVVDIGASDALAADTAAILRLVSDPNVYQRDIEVASSRLARSIFGGLRTLPVPRKLYILDEGVMSRIPLAVLPSWADGRPLIESTAVARVRIVPPQLRRTIGQANVSVFVAAQSDSGGGALPPLPAAKSEFARLRATLEMAGVRVPIDRGTTAEDLKRALGHSGAWIHVIAHGSTDPLRIGHSGLWLEPLQGSDRPEFTSWLNVLDRRAAADLVVLDACDLAKGSEMHGQNMSFAEATAMAGAREVVASAWQLSDAATETWVPAFYFAMAGDQGDAADAVRAAQLALRQRRSFRHPFYWAGLTAFQRWEVPTHSWRKRGPQRDPQP